MKKLLKSEVCGSYKQYTESIGVHKNVKNYGSTVREQYSTVREQCTCPPKLKRVQKKKKEQNANASSSRSKRSLRVRLDTANSK